MIKKLCGISQHPLTRNLDLDDPQTTALRRCIIQSKPSLMEIYQERYRRMKGFVSDSDHPILELGSGAGFLKQYFPGAIASDILPLPNIDLVCNAVHIPFADGEIRGILMTNVLHHLPDPRRFFTEADRIVVNGGVIVMVEPWANAWSSFIYSRFHHETFNPQVKEWLCESGKPLSNANGALPWIIFKRDRLLFESQFPHWHVEIIHPLMPLVYLLSGGVSMKNSMPKWTYRMWRSMEKLLFLPEHHFAMFALIVLRHTE